MSLCLFGAGKSAALAVSAFTLAWTHSVEKVEWQEDWRVTPAGLVLDAARVKGTGAGMEPPPEAKLEAGWWRWRPGGAPRSVMVLRRSGTTADWRLCAGEQCRPLGDILAADPIALSPCD
jgi:hypothetical protein